MRVYQFRHNRWRHKRDLMTIRHQLWSDKDDLKPDRTSLNAGRLDGLILVGEDDH